MKPAKVSRYPLTTQASPVAVKPRSRWIEGSATFTIDESRMTMNWQAHTSASTSRPRSKCVLRPAVSVLVSAMAFDSSIASLRAYSA